MPKPRGVGRTTALEPRAMNTVLIAVVSLDGRLTRPNSPGPGFASREDQVWFRRSLEAFDCAVMGRETFAVAQSGPEVSDSRRLRVVLTRTPDTYAARHVPGELEFSNAAPQDLVNGMRQRGFRRCAILGGGQVYRLFLDADLVDAIWLTLEPVLLGGGTPLVDGAIEERRFALAETRALSANTLLLNYHRRGAEAVPLPPP